MSKKGRESDIETGEVSLIPIMNLVCMLIPFLLYSASFVAFAAVDINLQRTPLSSVLEIEHPEQLQLTLVITDEGFRIATRDGQALPQSCGDVAESGATFHIPLANNSGSCVDAQGYPSGQDRQERLGLRLGPPPCAYDFGQLRSCMEEIKTDHPDEQAIMIGGEGGTDYEVLIHAMDAARGNDDSPLFPDVSLVPGLA